MDEQIHQISKKKIISISILLTLLTYFLKAFSCEIETSLIGIQSKQCISFFIHPLKFMMLLISPVAAVLLLFTFIGLFIIFFIFLYIIEKRNFKFKNLFFFFLFIGICIFSFNNFFFSFKNLAILTKNESLCKKLQDPSLIKDCTRSVFMEKAIENSALCNSLFDNIKDKDNCYFSVAIDTNNVSLCNNLSENKEMCKSQVEIKIKSLQHFRTEIKKLFQ